MLTGRYPEDFTMPEPRERVVPVREAWWVHAFPIQDDDFTAFYLWLIDGFAMCINNVCHQQVDVGELDPEEDVVEYFHRI